jgi:hypothetical protein
LARTRIGARSLGLAALLIWQVAGGDDDESGESVEAAGAARIVSEDELREAVEVYDPKPKRFAERAMLRALRPVVPH